MVVATAIYYVIDDITRTSEMEKSRDTALLISQNSQVSVAVARNNPVLLNGIMTKISVASDSDYIAVTDTHNVRLYHTENALIHHIPPDRPDDMRLRHGESFTGTKKGTSGLAVSTRTPLFYRGKYLGYVSVGYLEKNRLVAVLRYFFPFSLLLITVLVMIMISSLFSWRVLIRQMSGLSPEVINYRYQIRRAILHAIGDGIIALNREGEVLLINHAAQHLLSLDGTIDALAGKNITSLITPADCFLTQASREFRDQELTCNGSTFYASRSFIRDETDAIVGYVISLKEKNSRARLTTMLRQVKDESEELRVLSHEFKNKLAVISGLVELGEYARVTQFIQKENQHHQHFREDLLTVFHPPCIAGLILGKMGRARESGIELQIDPGSHYDGACSPLNDEEMACIIGNLLDNALEATLRMPYSPRVIVLYLCDKANEVTLFVQDNGPGPDHHLASALHTRGATCKTEPNHGIGLYLVNTLVQRVNGECIVELAEEKHGTLFSIYIPGIMQTAPQEQPL